MTHIPEIFVRPAPGRLVPLPGGGILPEAGALVPLDSFIRRRIADDDVLIGPAPAGGRDAGVAVFSSAPEAADPEPAPGPAADAPASGRSKTR